MVKTITVEAGDKLRDGEVAIWEKDDAHPDGEVYVTNRPGRAYRVGLTPAVQRALGEGRLEQVEDDANDAPKRGASRRTFPARKEEPAADPPADQMSGSQTSE